MAEFVSIHSVGELDRFIASPLSFIYISTDNCSVCHSLFPQIEPIIAEYEELAAGRINASEVPDIAGRLSIFTAPVLILFVEGKEVYREARIVHLDRFEEKLGRFVSGYLESRGDGQ